MQEVTPGVTFRMDFEHRCAKVLGVQDEDIAVGYWAEFVARRGTRAERRAAETSRATATPAVDDRVFTGADDVVDLLCLIADRAPDPTDEALAYLGAGPIEDLIARHAARFIDEIDGAARTSERFRRALQSTWFSESIDPSIARRLDRFRSSPESP